MKFVLFVEKKCVFGILMILIRLRECVLRNFYVVIFCILVVLRVGWSVNKYV